MFCVEQLQSEVEKPFLAFRENFKKDMKRFDHHIADLRKQLVGRYASVEKVHADTHRHQNQQLHCYTALALHSAAEGVQESFAGD